jgi:hypothetical protein
MTLSTDIYLTGPVDAKEVFDFCNSLMGAKNPSFSNEESSWSEGRWSYLNAPGQGYNAWMGVYYRPDGPLAAEDVWVEDTDVWTEDGSVYRYLDQKACTVRINFDTGYGYRDEFGGCSELHGRYIVALHRWAEDHGATLEWQNEFTGEYFKGLDGLSDFGGEGDKAADWVKEIYQLIKASVVEDIAKKFEDTK